MKAIVMTAAEAAAFSARLAASYGLPRAGCPKGARPIARGGVWTAVVIPSKADGMTAIVLTDDNVKALDAFDTTDFQGEPVHVPAKEDVTDAIDTKGTPWENKAVAAIAVDIPEEPKP